MKKELLNEVVHQLLESAETKYRLLNEAPVISRMTELVIKTLKAGNKVIILGNGGSAADAQHIAAELVGHFSRPNRRPLPALALTTNTSVLTSVANDYGYKMVFVRQLVALARRGDVLVALSTSGNSPNVLEAVKTARRLGLKTIGFTGQGGGKLKKLVDIAFCVPSKNTARIQECHITAGHIICQMVEEAF